MKKLNMALLLISFIQIPQALAKIPSDMKVDKDLFHCSLKAQDNWGKRIYVDIEDQPVILAQVSSEGRKNLQPVFVGDWVTKAFGGQIRFLGKTSIDKNNGSKKLMLGIYNMQKQLSVGSGIYDDLWVPPAGDKLQSWAAIPVYESIGSVSTEEDSVEIKVGTSISGGNVRASRISYSCKLK